MNSKLLTTAYALLFAGILSAQTPDKKIAAAVTEMNKDTAYLSFQQDLTKLTRAIKKDQTNFQAIRALFERNRQKLSRLSEQYGLNKLATPASTPPTLRKPALAWLNKLVLSSAVYKSAFTRSISIASNNPVDFTTLNIEDNAAKINFSIVSNGISGTPNSYIHRSLGVKMKGFTQKIRIPANPEYVAARIKVEYSCLYTGWDSGPSSFQPLIGISVSDNFRSAALDSLPTLYPISYWKIAAIPGSRFINLTPETIKDFRFSAESSFELEGYVIPGSEIEINVGYGMDSGAFMGLYGSYHYGEFTLKQITVTYVKAQ